MALVNTEVGFYLCSLTIWSLDSWPFLIWKGIKTKKAFVEGFFNKIKEEQAINPFGGVRTAEEENLGKLYVGNLRLKFLNGPETFQITVLTGSIAFVG